MSVHDTITIRSASDADVDAITAMSVKQRQHLCDPYGHVTAEKIRAHAFGPKPEYRVLLAEEAGRPVGYAKFTTSYEPAYAARGLYLIDLFVEQAYRRKGVARGFIERIKDEARADGRTFIWWVAQEWNTEALGFYESLSPAHRGNVTAFALDV